MHAAGKTSLASKIEAQEYCPEIYIYPTPRMYRPLERFSYTDLQLTDPINVYIHVPFCEQFCTFCGYFKTMYDEELQERFVEAVVNEITLRADCLSGRCVETLHFGGGTPSLLRPDQLKKLVEALCQVNPGILDSCREVSIEATPESVDYEKFAGYHRAGINRVSMGVQSLVDAEVILANRCLEKGRTSYRVLSDAVESLRAIGIADVVIDLMIGIDGQTIQSFEESLRLALTLRPQTVQLYALGLMPTTGLAKRSNKQIMDGRQIYQCYELGRRLFLDAGYRQDSHDRYTLHPINGFLQGDYNIRGMSLVGLGAGARSYSKTLHFRNVYTTLNGRKALEIYMDRVNSGLPAVETGVALDQEELMRQYAIGHILSLNLDDFEARFGVSYKVKFAEYYREVLDLDLAYQDGSLLRLTPRGVLFRDLLGRRLFSPKAQVLEEAYRARSA